jgi:7-cyano-7-deazaguanine synthase
MCGIYGAAGNTSSIKLNRLRENARDRGRDGGDMKFFQVDRAGSVWLGNWRATPTTEVERAPYQPYDGLVHNGTIANDKELGALPGEVDSMVLPRVLRGSDLHSFVESLARVKGSFALAWATDRDLYLAANYKPLYWWSPRRGELYFASMERHFDGVIPEGAAPVPLGPYEAMTWSQTDGATIAPLHRKRDHMGLRSLVIASAGLDSTTVAAMLRNEGHQVTLLHFRYGCLATKQELERIPRIAEALKCDYLVLDIEGLYKVVGGSTLLTPGSTIVPGLTGAEWAYEWVPARNLVMLSAATAYAEANGYDFIALGNNLEESGAYPDNEEEFTHRFNGLLDYAVNEGHKVRVLTPVGALMKHEIVRTGLALGAPYEHTWSCYKNGDTHCGECGPCYMRRTAFERNGAVDPVFAG